MTDNKGKKRSAKMVLFEFVMLAISVVAVFPIVYQVIASFKNAREINRPLSFPSSFYIDNFREAIVDGQFFLLLRNSLLVTAATMIIVVILGSLAAYPLARYSSRGYKLAYLYFLSGIMVPFQAGMIPLYKLVNMVGLTDNILSLILIQSGTCIPMSILIYSGFIKTIPVQLEEAAHIDGCGILGTYFRIVFPLLKPATISAIIVNIIPVWNDFLTPLIFISTATKKTLPVGMYNFMSERTASMGPIFAFSVLVCIAPIVLFLLLQKQFYKGLVAGAVKG